ncbi:winged helix-turn-helix transcriptional regulator [Thiocapsa bogorovii]|uniref:winged helix-turn-helix transcriptional regulator n=1 Tax=Thiocapsa bogorovii TaxID=521689 RepID=UPI001E335D63|nr:winged helix-turn-helix transcriptional regulator [Thiocapsa bogorovii]UHD16228.1 winged helix-turn-helix transcriptional regulator [Thiocapsa bogorovii]
MKHQNALFARGCQRKNCGGMAVACPRTTSMPSVLSDVLHYRILRLLEARPDISQRQLAKELGVSLGKTNYCVQALLQKDWIKV